MASPVQAEAHRHAAVVMPLTSCRPVTMMVPAPRKLMPLMTCAPNRPTSIRGPTFSATAAQLLLSISYSYWPSSIVSADPRHTSIYVRKPAARPLRPRSIPIIPPNSIASARRNSTDSGVICRSASNISSTPIPPSRPALSRTHQSAIAAAISFADI